MRKMLTISILFLAFGCVAQSQEKIVLDVPIQVDAGATEWQVSMVHMDWVATEITIRLLESAGGEYVAGGRQLVVTYRDSDAATLLKTWNTMDLSTSSLHKIIMEQLQADGHLTSGTITGTPKK